MGLLASGAAELNFDVDCAAASLLKTKRRLHPEAIAALSDCGVQLDRSETRRVTTQLVDGADVVLAMNRSEIDVLSARYPESVDRLFILSEFVADFAQLAYSPEAAFADFAHDFGSLAPHMQELPGAEEAEEIFDPVIGPNEQFGKAHDLIGTSIELFLDAVDAVDFEVGSLMESA